MANTVYPSDEYDYVSSYTPADATLTLAYYEREDDYYPEYDSPYDSEGYFGYDVPDYDVEMDCA